METHRQLSAAHGHARPTLVNSKVSDNIAAVIAMVSGAQPVPLDGADPMAPPAMPPIPVPEPTPQAPVLPELAPSPKPAPRLRKAPRADVRHDGHRERLRARLLERGAAALSDHELIEALLMLARPRIDTKPIAKRLLAEYGGIASLLSADADALKALPDMGEASAMAIKLAHAISQRALQAQTREKPVLANWQALLDYLRGDMGALIHERVRILYLDSKNRLLRDHLMSEGSVDQSAIYVREVVKRALDLGATALIIVHNHPSGDPSPSRQDIAITRDIAEACKRFAIAVHDHIIIAGDAHVSLKAQGLI